MLQSWQYAVRLGRTTIAKTLTLPQPRAVHHPPLPFELGTIWTWTIEAIGWLASWLAGWLLSLFDALIGDG